MLPLEKYGTRAEKTFTRCMVQNMYFKNVLMKNIESTESLNKVLSCQFHLFSNFSGQENNLNCQFAVKYISLV